MVLQGRTRYVSAICSSSGTGCGAGAAAVAPLDIPDCGSMRVPQDRIKDCGFRTRPFPVVELLKVGRPAFLDFSNKNPLQNPEFLNIMRSPLWEVPYGDYGQSSGSGRWPPGSGYIVKNPPGFLHVRGRAFSHCRFYGRGDLFEKK